MTKALAQKKKARSFSGCKCCKQAKRKCPEQRPRCSICEKLGLKCEYDLNFLFRCEMVDFSGHISKADRITRPGAQKTQKRSVSPSTSDHPTSTQKYIQYEFIDESASIMSPTFMSEDHAPTPTASMAGSPSLAFRLLLEAADASDADKSNRVLPQILTPPQSPEPGTSLDRQSRFVSPETKLAGVIGIYTELGN